jgi:hypothetical protein
MLFGEKGDEMKSTVGKVSAIMVLLTFILASAFVLNIALAQNETNALENVTVNETVDNGTASWDFVEGILLNETVENVTIPNETSNETSLSNITETVANEINIILNDTVSNETNLNITLNETNQIVVNETNVTSNNTEIVLNETEEIIEPPVIESPAKEPKFDVKLLYPQRITRGESIKIKADLTSDSFAKNVYLKWVLPDGFEIISGNYIEACGNLDANVSCSSEIDAMTDLSGIGLSEIKVVVSYEK